MNHGSVSALIGELKKERLAVSTRDSEDGRSALVSLTPWGSASVVRTLDLRGTEYYARMERMTAEELSMLTSLLSKFTSPPQGHSR